MLSFAPYTGPVRIAPSLGDVPQPAYVPPTQEVSAGISGKDLLLGMGVPVVILTASIAASAYHGYKRNRSTGWAIWWGVMGAIFPIITPAVAIAQGFGKRSG